ncbi:MAG: response regulator transcription factor, partial [Chloroflexota bacterium]|nr:response regulator transcription factor [Chloroflexota bacterium]
VWPMHRRWYDPAEAQLRHVLGDDAFAMAWGHGWELPIAEAVAEGLRVTLPPSTTPVAAAGSARDTGLSRREIDVLRLIADGHSDREIAGALGISRRTATTHLTHILDKLGLDSRTAAATYAVRHGLV